MHVLNSCKTLINSAVVPITYVLMQIKLRIKQLIVKTRTAFDAACSLYYNDFEECESDSDDMDTDSDDSEDDSASY